MENPKTQKTVKKWQDLVAQHQASGKTATAWCHEQGISYETFIMQRSCLRQMRLVEQIAKKEDFIELQDTAIDQKSLARPAIPNVNSQFIELKTPSPGLILECANVLIHISEEFNALTLKKCLQILRGELC